MAGATGGSSGTQRACPGPQTRQFKGTESWWRNDNVADGAGGARSWLDGRRIACRAGAPASENRQSDFANANGK
jgi:hypothetical protein